MKIPLVEIIIMAMAVVLFSILLAILFAGCTHTTRDRACSYNIKCKECAVDMQLNRDRSFKELDVHN
jgi:hypothetical protein